MTAEVQKYTLEQIESLELAPGTEHEKLEGWVPALASEEDLKQALEKAFDYRGDVTLTLKSGERIDLIVTDMVMPGLNGMALARLARPMRPEVRILFSSAFWGT